MTSWHPLPPPIYSYIERTPGTVLLHSSRPGGSPFSRLFTSPLRIIEVREIKQLGPLFSHIEQATEKGLFAAGFFAYECAEYFEPTAGVRPPRDAALIAWFGIYDQCHTFDHRSGTLDPDLPQTSARESRIDERPFEKSRQIDFAVNEQQFSDRVRNIHDHIRAGDVYQLNLTFPLRAQFPEPEAALYQRLSAAQPVDYGAFLHTQSGRHILSFSPELFFRIDSKRHITTQPMKGTAPRGRTTSEDLAIARWLAHDAKNCAENVMIVDLIRNDLGRICSFGSVKAEKLFEVERYPSLWQMISRISGDLRPSIRHEDVFRALFPCGSITGAPKIRAMQLLGKIEEGPRGVYTGAIGYFSRQQTVFNVAIRTLELENSSATMGVGAGIVIDSNAPSEFRECRLKAEFLTRSSEPLSLIETMLWNRTCPLLELHLDRLTDSASYFDFECNRDAIRKALRDEASRFQDDHPRKVRLLLDAAGTVQLTSEIVSVPHGRDQLRICIATTRTDASDRFLFHKTTRRELYNRAYASASSAGFTDVFFLNTRGEVTEGAVHNIFIEKSGRWYTPPLDCGVLPGVYRRHLLETQPNVEEKTLTLNDLKAADSVYVCNAVRGLRRIAIDWNASLSLTGN